MAFHGKYIYGIIPAAKKMSFPIHGFRRFFWNKVHTLCYRDIAALVSTSPLITYMSTEKNLLTHMSVLQEVLKEYSVIPMRFGTIAKSKKEVQGLLENVYPAFKQAFQKIDRKVEFDVEARWDTQTVAKEISEEIPEIRQLKEKLTAQGSQTSLQDKIAIGAMIAREAQERKDRYTREIREFFGPIILEVSPLPPKGEDTVMHSAFLVSRNSSETFEEKIRLLDKRFNEKLKLKYAGPLPPYCFTGIQVTILNPRTLEEARGVLGLGKEVSLKEVKERYRTLAGELHPDRRPGDQAAEEHFKKVDQAYKLMTKYFEHEKVGEENRLSFTKEKIQRPIFITETLDGR